DSRGSVLEHATGQASSDAKGIVTKPSRSMEPDEAKPDDSQSKAPVVADSVRFRAAERKRLVNAVIDNLKRHYFDPEVARKTADALMAHEKNGDDDKVTDGGAFADLLTKQLRQVSHDMHLEVVYSQA